MATVKPIQTKYWQPILAMLFVMVLIAHLATITLARGQFDTKKAVQTTAFTTRIVELPVPTPVTERKPEVVTPPKAEKRKPVAVIKPKELTVAPEVTTSKPQALVDPTTAPVASTVVSTVVSVNPVESLSVQPSLMPPPTEVAAQPPEPAQLTPTPAASPSEAGLPPPAFTALSSAQHRYQVTFLTKGNADSGTADIRWQHDGEKYDLELVTTYKLFFNPIVWKSVGNLSPQGLLPVRFSDKRLRKSEVAAHFEYTSGKIIFSTNKPEAQLMAGAQDRISVIWQIAGMLAAEPARYPSGYAFSMQTASSSDAELWLFTVNEPETLNLSTGSQIALRLTRNPRREFDQKIELWFAPALNYLPVRFRFTEANGDYLDAFWQSANALQNNLPTSATTK
jgi:hypothetical protein